MPFLPAICAPTGTQFVPVTSVGRHHAVLVKHLCPGFLRHLNFVPLRALHLRPVCECRFLASDTSPDRPRSQSTTRTAAPASWHFRSSRWPTSVAAASRRRLDDGGDAKNSKGGHQYAPGMYSGFKLPSIYGGGEMAFLTDSWRGAERARSMHYSGATDWLLCRCMARCCEGRESGRVGARRVVHMVCGKACDAFPLNHKAPVGCHRSPSRSGLLGLRPAVHDRWWQPRSCRSRTPGMALPG